MNMRSISRFRAYLRMRNTFNRLCGCHIRNLREINEHEIGHRTHYRMLYGTGMCAGTRTLLGGGETQWL